MYFGQYVVVFFLFTGEEIIIGTGQKENRRCRIEDSSYSHGDRAEKSSTSKDLYLFKRLVDSMFLTMQ
jgi:hypothetical protein